MRPSSPRIARRVAAFALTAALVACSKPAPTPSPPPPPPSASASPTDVEIGGVDDVAQVSAHGITFSYPKTWRRLQLGPPSAQTGPTIWNESVGVDDVNLVSVAAYRLKQPITPENFGAAKDSIAKVVADTYAAAGGGVDAGPDAATLGDLPALAFTGTAQVPEAGGAASSRVVIGFDGRTEYYVYCQFTGHHEAEIVAGCGTITDSFQTT